MNTKPRNDPFNENRLETAAPGGETTLREVVGFFHDEEPLFRAVSDLESAGIDRAELSLLARESLTDGRAEGEYGDTREAAEDPDAPRDPVFADTDVRQVRTMGTSIAGSLAGMAAAGVTIVTGGAAAVALAAAAAAGVGTAAVTEAVGRKAGKGEHDHLREQIENGGIILWVKVRDAATEAKAADILTRNGATDVHAHDMPKPRQ